MDRCRLCGDFANCRMPVGGIAYVQTVSGEQENLKVKEWEMDIRQSAGLVLLAMMVVSLAGCSHGSGVELGVFGSSLDSDDLGTGYGGGAKLELNPIDLVSVDGLGINPGLLFRF